MSSVYVRQMAEQWVTAVGTIPYYNTINNAPEPNDNIWLTLDFDSFGATKETYCNEFVEDGEIRLIFLGRIGLGWNALMTAAEDYAALFMLQQDATNKLILTQSNPPIEYAGNSNPWFIVEVSIEYQLYL